jgi:hypothetical protein
MLFFKSMLLNQIDLQQLLWQTNTTHLLTTQQTQ